MNYIIIIIILAIITIVTIIIFQLNNTQGTIIIPYQLIQTTTPSPQNQTTTLSLQNQTTTPSPRNQTTTLSLQNQTTTSSPQNQVSELKNIDCKVDEWSGWGACSAPCGGGKQERTRSVITQPKNGGRACPELKETQACNTNDCPVDCKVDEWSGWGACSAPCGGGAQERTRSVITQPKNGGRACPELKETQACNTQQCNIDCKVDEWSGWGACSAPCGGGTQERTRSITTQQQGNGNPCPSLKETIQCNNEPCSFVSKSNKIKSKNECKTLLDNHNLANFYTDNCSNPYNSNNMKACQTMACGAGNNYDNWYAAGMNMLGCDYLYNNVTNLRNEDKLKEDCNLIKRQNLEITEGKDDITDCINDYCSILENSENCKYAIKNFTKNKSEKNCSKKCFCSNLEWYNNSMENNEENRKIGLRNSNVLCLSNYTRADCN
jgi:hypothetical protein